MKINIKLIVNSNKSLHSQKNIKSTNESTKSISSQTLSHNYSHYVVKTEFDENESGNILVF